jgi:glucose-6-phosphate isomerase
MTNQIPLAIENDTLLSSSLGPAGIAPETVHALSPRLDALRRRLPDWRAGRVPSFLSLPYAADTAALAARGRDIAARLRQTVVFGIGGSSLGGEMLVRILSDPGRDHPVRFYDNIDPASLIELTQINWAETCLLVVSKSGTTAETLCQFLSLLPTIEKQIGVRNLPHHVYVITENRDGPLFQLAGRLGLEVIPHPPVGGRYSVLSVVGLLPAAIAGVDIEQLLAGGRAMAERCGQNSMESNPAFWNGACQYLHAERGRTLSVHMTYCDRLRPVLRWFRQLWAESLGKHDAAGRARGLTPVEAYGVTDQHSQLQLYLAGPDDKQFTFLTSPALHRSGLRIPERFADIPEVAALAGHTMGELFAAEFEAIRTTLTRNHRPHRTLRLRPDDPAALGELIVLFEMETVVVAELLGVDPFDQPAVEEGMILAREYIKTFRA